MLNGSTSYQPDCREDGREDDVRGQGEERPAELLVENAEKPTAEQEGGAEQRQEVDARKYLQ
jgi:hypothetical protein